MRKKIIVGNWKMNLILDNAQDLVFKLVNKINKDTNVDIGICPPSIYLLTLCNLLKNQKGTYHGTSLLIGAQNMFYKEEGAYTGEISPLMLKDLKIDMVIIGHSERRQYFHETDEDVNLKIKAALKYGLVPIFCVGEDLSCREKGKAEEHVKKQVLAGLKDLKESEIEKIIIAYEPIWAIGTGKICSGEDANKIIKMIREIVGKKVRILYGGSIKSDNFKEHIQYPDIDGGLVGGASLSFDEFYKIIELASDVPTRI